jgi:16S rRNA G966 N2-methylase RsmD
MMQMNNCSLYFGDNLEILREKFHGDEGYFDLIYLDPPFNSNAPHVEPFSGLLYLDEETR